MQKDKYIKNTIFAIIALGMAQNIYALDFKYAAIVNAALADLKTHTKLSLMKGHAAIHVSSGNKDLDTQLGEELQKAYPALTSKADTVRSEDLYELTAKVYREGEAVFVELTLTGYKKQNLIDRTASVKKVPAAVLETIQYKSALTAKNEFETYLDGTFGTTSEVVHEARLIPDYIKSGLHFLEVLEKYDSAIAEFKKEIEHGTRKAEAYYYIGDAYYYQDKYDEAINYYTQAILINPVPVPNTDYDDAYLARGKCYYEKKDYNRAIQDFNESEKFMPKNAELYFARGRAYFMINNTTNAEADLSKSIALNSKIAYAYFYRGAIYGGNNKYDNAIADYSKGIKLSPNEEIAYYMRAFAYYRKGGSKQKAIDDCNAALKINPNYKNARELLALLLQPEPPKEPFVMPEWLKPTFYDDDDAFFWLLSAGTTADYSSFFALGLTSLFYGDLGATIKKYSIVWDKETVVHYNSYHVGLGTSIPYNQYLLFPISIGIGWNSLSYDDDSISKKMREEVENALDTSADGVFGTGFTFSVGVMLHIKLFTVIVRYRPAIWFKPDRSFEFLIGISGRLI